MKRNFWWKKAMCVLKCPDNKQCELLENPKESENIEGEILSTVPPRNKKVIRFITEISLLSWLTSWKEIILSSSYKTSVTYETSTYNTYSWPIVASRWMSITSTWDTSSQVQSLILTVVSRCTFLKKEYLNSHIDRLD